MKFLVDTLPYYGFYECPFEDKCPHNGTDECPQLWDKYKVSSTNEEEEYNNPHECYWLKEVDNGKS